MEREVDEVGEVVGKIRSRIRAKKATREDVVGSAGDGLVGDVQIWRRTLMKTKVRRLSC